MRIGHGYDVHAFADGRALILGGVPVNHTRGLAGHSDADVVTHAIIDALLGAASLPDIGQQFSDSDPQYENIDSLILLKKTGELIAMAGYAVGNIDATIVAQQPRLAAYIQPMRSALATALGIPCDNINVKATTEEGLGFTGGNLGIAAHAVCILVHNR